MEDIETAYDSLNEKYMSSLGKQKQLNAKFKLFGIMLQSVQKEKDEMKLSFETMHLEFMKLNRNESVMRSKSGTHTFDSYWQVAAMFEHYKDKSAKLDEAFNVIRKALSTKLPDVDEVNGTGKIIVTEAVSTQMKSKPFMLSETEQQRSYIKSINQLEPEMQHNRLLNIYSKFGVIRKLLVETTYKCWALVEFEDPSIRDRAVTAIHVMSGQLLNVATTKKYRNTKNTEVKAFNYSKSDLKSECYTECPVSEINKNQSIAVSGFTTTTQHNDLRTHFSEVGIVTKVALIKVRTKKALIMFEKPYALRLANPSMSKAEARKRCRDFGKGDVEILYDNSLPELANPLQQNETTQPADEINSPAYRVSPEEQQSSFSSFKQELDHKTCPTTEVLSTVNTVDTFTCHSCPLEHNVQSRVVFNPCCHGSCSDCAAQLKKCHICSTVIESKVKQFE